MSYGRSMGSALVWLTVLAAPGIAGCGTGTPGPDITYVRPSSAEPGGLVLVSGRNFRDGDVVAIDGRPAATVTWVNAQLLTATLPATFPEGAYALEVRSTDGRRAATTLSVRAPTPVPTPPPAVQAPSESMPPPSAPEVRPHATPSQVAAPANTTEELKKAEEQLREGQKREEERRREEEKKKREEEKKRNEQQGR